MTKNPFYFTIMMMILLLNCCMTTEKVQGATCPRYPELGAYQTFVDCSNMGTCQQDGTCKCNENAYGDACQFVVSFVGRKYMAPYLGFKLKAVYSLLADDKSQVSYDTEWSQISGPSQWSSSAYGLINSDELVVKGKSDVNMDYMNGYYSGSTFIYGFRVKATYKGKVYQSDLAQFSIQSQNDPTLGYKITNMGTGAEFTGGKDVVGTAIDTKFKLSITSNSNPYQDTTVQYLFGYVDQHRQLYTFKDFSVSGTEAEFTLPPLNWDKTREVYYLELYVMAVGDKSLSFQKLTYLTVTDPVAKKTPDEIIDFMNSKLTSTATVDTFQSVASILNRTTSSTNTVKKQELRDKIINFAVNPSNNLDAYALISMLNSAARPSKEVTSAQADKILAALQKIDPSSLQYRQLANALEVVALIVSTSGANSAELTKTMKFLTQNIGGKLPPKDSVLMDQPYLKQAIINYAKDGKLVLGTYEVNFKTFVAKRVSTSSSSSSSSSFECLISNSTECSGFYSISFCSQPINSCIPTCFGGTTSTACSKLSGKYNTVIPVEISQYMKNGTEIESGGSQLQTDIVITAQMNSTDPAGVCSYYNQVTDEFDMTKVTTIVNADGSISCKTKYMKGTVFLAKNSVVSHGSFNARISLSILVISILSYLFF